MEFIRGLHNLQPRHHGCVATIGNFDGVHRGHQAVLEQLKRHAARLQVPACVICFEPTPQEYFLSGAAPARLSRLREKLAGFARQRIDRVLCLEFGQALAGMEPDDFIARILVDGLGVQYLVVGDDFRFGNGRKGDYALLERSGAAAGFPVERTTTCIAEDGQRISSTRVREALAAGQFDLAAELIGARYRICGRVAPGDQRGRGIGFPTANIFLHRRRSPLAGVYAVTMHGVENRPVPGVANLGVRPTVDGHRQVLEVHLFDFQRSIYGAHVEVEFFKRLRDERKFESFAALKRQIRLDALAAREFFSTGTTRV
jgi:riboflavin kinase/FMN adenylyltransferase